MYAKNIPYACIPGTYMLYCIYIWSAYNVRRQHSSLLVYAYVSYICMYPVDSSIMYLNTLPLIQTDEKKEKKQDPYLSCHVKYIRLDA